MDLIATQTTSLWDALASVPDHRRSEGKRYPLASLLLIAVAAMLAGRRDQLGIVRWVSCCRKLGSASISVQISSLQQQHPSAKQVNAGAAIHGALETSCPFPARATG